MIKIKEKNVARTFLVTNFITTYFGNLNDAIFEIVKTNDIIYLVMKALMVFI